MKHIVGQDPFRNAFHQGNEMHCEQSFNFKPFHRAPLVRPFFAIRFLHLKY